MAVGLVISCPPENHCEDDVCDSNTGFCTHGCKESWNGPRCDTQTTCPNCQWGYCNPARVCLRGCYPGFYGDTCNKSCHAHCKNKCDFKTGNCMDGCKLGWYGPYCTKKCGGGCVPNSCHRWHGTCQCQSGWYTEGCSQECIGCLDRACDHLNGRCRRGCKPGWTGVTCSINICRNCVNSTCLPETSGSRCHGCVSGYRGRNCEEKCADNCAVCSQFGSTCSECKHGSTCITTPTTFASNSISITVTSEGWTSVPNIGRSNVIQNSANGWKTYSSSGVRRTSFIFVCVLLAFAVSLTVWCAREMWRQRKPKTRTGLDTWNFSEGNVPRHCQSSVTQLQETDLNYDGFRTWRDRRNNDESRHCDCPAGYESLRYMPVISNSASRC
ncbi:scavenger receptor class F member 1-like [Haliotis asinina]|uniref:scavenger receptor class F member 1-like n=1 Tax=Haliotis asinina TaxID=109174 RepID=UPI0035321BC0